MRLPLRFNVFATDRAAIDTPRAIQDCTRLLAHFADGGPGGLAFLPEPDLGTGPRFRLQRGWRIFGGFGFIEVRGECLENPPFGTRVALELRTTWLQRALVLLRMAVIGSVVALLFSVKPGMLAGLWTLPLFLALPLTAQAFRRRQETEVLLESLAEMLDGEVKAPFAKPPPSV